MFIDNKVKILINLIKAKLSTTGSEPATGSWDTIEEQNKLLYDKILNLVPFIEFDYKAEYHTAWDYYPYPSRGYQSPYGWDIPHPLNILNMDKPYVVLEEYSSDSAGRKRPPFLWSPLGGEINSINFWKDNFQLIGTYFDTYLKLVFLNLLVSAEPKTIERNYTMNGAYMREEELDGWVFNSLEVIRESTGTTYHTNYIKAPLMVSLQTEYQFSTNSYDYYGAGKTTLVKIDEGWYIGIGGIGIFMEDTIKKIIFLQDPTMTGNSNIFGNTLCNGEVWGYTQFGVLRFKC